MPEEKYYYIEPDMKKVGMSAVHQIFRQTAEPYTVSARAHIHRVVEFIYVENGSFTAWLGDRDYLLSAGDLLLIRSGEIHRILAGEDKFNSYCVIKIDPDMIFSFADESNGASYSLALKLGKERKSHWTKDEVVKSGIGEALEGIISEKFNPMYAGDIALRCRCAQLLYLILRETYEEEPASVSPAAGSTVHLINKSIEYINEKYNEDITAKECSKVVGLSYSYFSRTFKAVTGRFFSEYLTEVRLNRAKKLLLTTDKQVSEIAYECGFSDPCYFISTFRKKNSLTPKQFRSRTVNAKND